MNRKRGGELLTKLKVQFWIWWSSMIVLMLSIFSIQVISSLSYSLQLQRCSMFALKLILISTCLKLAYRASKSLHQFSNTANKSSQALLFCNYSTTVLDFVWCKVSRALEQPRQWRRKRENWKLTGLICKQTLWTRSTLFGRFLCQGVIEWLILSTWSKG